MGERTTGAANVLGTSLTDAHMGIVRAFHAQRAHLRPTGAELGLGPGQPKLLSYLAVKGTATQREMAGYFGIDAAAVSRMLDVLERGGFVTSTAKPNDRRAKELALTDRGRATVAAWDACCAQVEARMFRGFTAEERSQFQGFLERVIGNLTAPESGEARHA